MIRPLVLPLLWLCGWFGPVGLVHAQPPQAQPSSPAPWVLPAPDQASGLQRLLWQSRAAGAQVSAYVFTPPEYAAQPQRRFPVLYWLHGSGGSSPGAAAQVSARYAQAMAQQKIPPMILVFPNGLPMGMWCDWKDGSFRHETMFINELLPHVDRHFRTQAAREGRILEGFSMGGYGAARLGFKHQQCFAGVSLLGAGPLQQDFHEAPRAGPRGREEVFQKVYGSDMAYFRAQSPWRMAEQNAAKLKQGLIIRQVIGNRDETLGFNRAFKQHLDALQIPHTYRQLPNIPHDPNLLLKSLGEDNWAFYRQALTSSARSDGAAGGGP